MKSKFLQFSIYAILIGLAFFLTSSIFIQIENETSDANNGSAFKPAAEYLAKIRNNQVTGKLDLRDVLKSREQLKMNQSMFSRDLDLEWIICGPSNFGGRTRAIIYDNRDPDANTLYAASVSGGIYKSTNSAQTWSKVNGDEKSLNVSCMIQDNDGSIYVGTGESFAVQDFTVFGELQYNGGFVGTGIFKSTDGEHFELVPGTEPAMNSDTAAWAFINELVIDPITHKLYTSTNKGLKYLSANTWKIAKTSEGEILNSNSFDVKIGSDGTIVTDIDNLCYVSVTGDPNAFVLRSTGDSASLPNSDIGRIEFAIAPTNTNIIYASVANGSGALKNIYRSTTKGEYWSIIAPGGSANLNIFGIDDEIGSGQGIYDNTIVVFPDNPDRILVGGINMWEGLKVSEEGFFNWTMKSDGSIDPYYEPYVPSDHHTYVFRPGNNRECIIGCDGGVSAGSLHSDYFTFTTLVRNYYTTQFYTVGYSGDKKMVIGGAQDNGVQFINGNSNPATAQYGTQIWQPDGGDGGYAAISLIDPNVFIYSKNGGLIRRTEDQAQNVSPNFLASEINIPESTFLTTFLLWESFTNENSRDSVFFFSKQNNYQAGDKVLVLSNNREYPFEYTLPHALPANDSILVKDIISTKFFLAIDDKVWMTQQAINFAIQPYPEWFLISDKSHVNFDGDPQCIAATTDANYVFIGTQEGRLYRISNIALAYDYKRADVRSPYCIISTTEIPVNIPETGEQISQVITSVSVDPKDPNIVIITLGNYGNEHYIFRSTNALAEVPEFTSIQGDTGNGGLPQMPVYSSVIEMGNQNIIMIGTEEGIFISDNVGISSPTWYQPEDISEMTIGHTPVFMLRQQIVAKTPVPVWYWDGVDSTLVIYPGTDNYGVIYTATHGRGLFYCDQFEKPVGINDPIADKSFQSDIILYPNPARDNVNVVFNLEEPSTANIYIFDINGRIIKTVNLNRMGAGPVNYILDCNTLPNGTYFLQIAAGKTREISKFIVIK